LFLPKEAMKSNFVFAVLSLLHLAVSTKGPKDKLMDRNLELGYKPKDRTWSEFQVDEKTLQVESGSREGEKSFSLNFRMTTDGVPRFMLKFSSKGASESESSKVKFATRLGLFRLVEYNDTIAPLDSNRFLSLVLHPRTSWSDLRSGVENLQNSEGATVKSVRTSLVYNNDIAYQNLNVTLKTYFTDKPTTSNRTVLNPDSIKYSVYINNWPYSLNNGRLALVHAVWVKDTKLQLNDTTKRSITLSGGLGRFDWDTAITINGGQDATVELDQTIYKTDKLSGPTSTNEGEDTGDSPRFVNFLFPGGAQDIVWDPEFGINSDPVEQLQLSNSSSIASSSFLALILSTLVAWFV